MNSNKVRATLGKLIRKDSTIYNNKRKTIRMVKLVRVNPKKVEQITKKLTALGATNVIVKRVRVWFPSTECKAFKLDVLAHFPLDCK